MKKASLILLAIVTALCCACRTQKHVVTQSEQQTQTTGSHTAVQVLQSFDSLLHTFNFSADSIVVELIPAAPDGSHSYEASPANGALSSYSAGALSSSPNAPHFLIDKEADGVQAASGKPAEAGDPTAGTPPFSSSADNSSGINLYSTPLPSQAKPANSRPVLRITAHRPQVSITRQENNLVIAQQVERDSAASSVLANSHADVSDDKVGVASPMNGTVVIVIVLLAVLLIAAVFLWLFLRKYKII